MYVLTIANKQTVNTKILIQLPDTVGTIRLSGKMLEQVETYGKTMIERLETEEGIIILKEGVFEMVETEPFIIN